MKFKKNMIYVLNNIDNEKLKARKKKKKYIKK